MRNPELSQGSVQSKKRRHLKQNLWNRQKKRKKEKKQRNERFEPIQVEEFYRNNEGGIQMRRVLLTADNTEAMKKNEA